jgi:hypothetical protein
MRRDEDMLWIVFGAPRKLTQSEHVSMMPGACVRLQQACFAQG